MNKYRANEYALPIEVIPPKEGGKWSVVTGLGLPVGPRLLKGVSPPVINDWGPFDSEDDAIRLQERLIRHMDEWPVKRRKKH